ncbi:LysR family transcriptional regulator [Falsiroseomonas sp. HW251]|uniref:LysR family transcriptional regulator n=1 Tax=Falsiroseomonas sp. HW251 TaxID=3390998 RepID=UPI003D311782
MELHEIRYALAVGETRNFTRAAERCHVTQPALTRAIQKIEAELGGLLFSRERGNVHPTELGRLLLPHFAEVMERTRTAREAALRFLSLDDAPLRIGVMCTIGPMRFVGFLSCFRAAHPGVELALTEGTPARLTQTLLAGELDVAILASPDGFDDPLRAEPLYAERFGIACGAMHPFARRNQVAMRELDGEFYLQRVNCEYRDTLREALEASGARIERCCRSERDDWIQTMVAAGMGVCFLPEFAATCPGVLLRRVVDPEVVREVCVVTVRGRRWSPPLASFVEAVRRHPWRAAEEGGATLPAPHRHDAMAA